MEETIERILQGNQETLEDLVGKFVFLSKDDGTKPKSNGCDADASEQFTGMQNGIHHEAVGNVALKDTLEDELPTQELDEGTSISQSIYRVLEEKKGITPKVGNFVESDVSDLSSDENFSDIEAELDDKTVENNVKKQQTSDSDIQQQSRMAAGTHQVINEEKQTQDVAKPCQDIKINLQKKSNADFNVLVLNYVNDTDPLPGQVCEEKENYTADNVDVNITNLEIHTRIKKEEPLDKSEFTENFAGKIVEDIVEDFELDKHFDYDNVELTPKDWNLRF